MALPFLVLGAMAGSAILGNMSRKAQYNNARRAQELEEQQIDLRMKQERLAYEEQGLSSLENLREVMASTQALFAAQGRVPGVGTTAAIQRKSIREFNKDESARALSVGFREHYYKSQKAVGRLALHGLKQQNKVAGFKSAFDLFNFSGFGDFGSSSKGQGKLADVGDRKLAPVERRITNPRGFNSGLSRLRGL